MSYSSGLTVRQHKREEIELTLEFIVSKEHATQVRFSNSSGAAGERTVRGTSTDLSRGGLGMLSPLFVPRMCEGVMRVFDPRPVGTTQDGAAIYDVAFEHSVKVRRVALASHEPMYALGMSFVDAEPDLEQRVEKIRDELEKALEEVRGGAADA